MSDERQFETAVTTTRIQIDVIDTGNRFQVDIRICEDFDDVRTQGNVCSLTVKDGERRIRRLCCSLKEKE